VAAPRQGRPFKRNDRMLEILPIGVIVCAGSGISASLADKARMLGIPIWSLWNGGARAPFTSHRWRGVGKKTREEANIKLDSVISNILGMSGRRMIEAMIAGVGNPSKLAELAGPRIKASPK
jgi:hypothetical protein